MKADEKLERAAFARWLKKAHPDVSARRYGKPAQDQYIVCAVQEAWQGWWERSHRYTRRELERAQRHGKAIAASLRVE